MATVRREGDWRLVKRSEGVYEVTYRKEPQMEVLTSEAPPNTRSPFALDSVPVREVRSYSEAEGLFEELAHGPPPTGFMEPLEASPTLPNESIPVSDYDDIDLSDLPPGALGVVLLVSGGFLIYILGINGNQYGLLIGSGFALGGLVVFAYGGFIGWSQGWSQAWDYFTTVDEDSKSKSQDSGDSPSKTSPVPERQKNELIFGRAKQVCEWCESGPLDNPEVHHIKPRNKGGPNKSNNLIVLCPTCHRKADRGGISQTKLRGKVRHILSEYEPDSSQLSDI